MTNRNSWFYRQAKAKLTGDWNDLTAAAFDQAAAWYGEAPVALISSFGEDPASIEAVREELDEAPHLVSFRPDRPPARATAMRTLIVHGEHATLERVATLARDHALRRFAYAGPETLGRLAIFNGATGARIETLDPWSPPSLRALHETFVRASGAADDYADRAWDWVPPRGLATARPLGLARTAAATDLGLDLAAAEGELEQRFGVPMLRQDAWYFDE